MKVVITVMITVVITVFNNSCTNQSESNKILSSNDELINKDSLYRKVFETGDKEAYIILSDYFWDEGNEEEGLLLDMFMATQFNDSIVTSNFADDIVYFYETRGVSYCDINIEMINFLDVLLLKSIDSIDSIGCTPSTLQ